MNKLLVEKIRKAYTKRLLEALSEVEVVDKEGNILISKDLKVFHKKSGYEYTVDDVVKHGDGIGIVLRKPEEPRFDPADSTEILDELDQLDQRVERFISPAEDAPDDHSLDDDVFIVDEKSFAEEYEVK